MLTATGDVANLNAAGGIDWERTFRIPGYFEKSLTPELIEKHRIRKVGVALIDCDLYSSTVEVLNFLRALIGDKTVLVMDDWNCFGADDNKGQRRAMREFLETESHLSLEPLLSYGEILSSVRCAEHIGTATAPRGTALAEIVRVWASLRRARRVAATTCELIAPSAAERRDSGSRRGIPTLAQ